MAIDILALAQKKPEKIDYILPGLVAGTVGAIISPGGAGKSAFALQLAAQVAGGPDLLGLGEITSGSSAYIPGEDPELIIQHRTYALLEHCSPDHLQNLNDLLLIEPLDHCEIDILQPDWFERFIGFATGRRLLIIDTLRMVHDLEESDSGDMKRVVARFRMIAAKTGCAVVFLHHTNKISTFTGAGGEQQASRGSSVLVDNIRWQGYLRGMTEEEAPNHSVKPELRGFFVEFGVSKQNYGRPVAPRWLRKISAADEDIEAGYTLQPAVVEKPKNNKKRASEYAG